MPDPDRLQDIKKELVELNAEMRDANPNRRRAIQNRIARLNKLLNRTNRARNSGVSKISSDKLGLPSQEELYGSDEYGTRPIPPTSESLGLPSQEELYGSDEYGIGNAFDDLAPSLIGAGGAAALFKLLQPLLQGSGQFAGQVAGGFGPSAELLDPNTPDFTGVSGTDIFNDRFPGAANTPITPPPLSGGYSTRPSSRDLIRSPRKRRGGSGGGGPAPKRRGGRSKRRAPDRPTSRRFSSRYGVK